MYTGQEAGLTGDDGAEGGDAERAAGRRNVLNGTWLPSDVALDLVLQETPAAREQGGTT